MSSTTWKARAIRWTHGWELHVDGVGVTQSRTLDDAARMVRDYVASYTGRETQDDDVAIEPDLGGLEERAAAVREQVARAQAETQAATAALRQVAVQLRAAGLSAGDAATVLGVSRQRASQLTRGDSAE